MKVVVAAPSVFAIVVLSLAPFCHQELARGQQVRANRNFSVAAPASKNGFEQEIIALERSSWDLAIKRDTDGYRALHASNFFTVSGLGVTDRSQSEASALDVDVHFDHYELSRFTVKSVGTDAALVTYRVNAAGSDHGKPFVMNSYASSLWVRQTGGWLNVFYQATPVHPV